jgi:DNA-binding NarL/FixJ family response regulator
MGVRNTSKLGDMKALVRVVQTSAPAHLDDPLQRKRRMVADLCKLVAKQLGQPVKKTVGEDLSPRLRQTLQHLLEGDSEKQIARKLGLSPHTVHIYVKSLYKHYDVCSRSELLAKWIGK